MHIRAKVYKIAKNTFEKYILHIEVHIYVLVLITDGVSATCKDICIVHSLG